MKIKPLDLLLSIEEIINNKTLRKQLNDIASKLHNNQYTNITSDFYFTTSILLIEKKLNKIIKHINNI